MILENTIILPGETIQNQITFNSSLKGLLQALFLL